METVDRLGLTLMSIAACLSITVFFYAPYFFHIHGGIAFLIPYVLFLLLLGLPFLILEQVVGSRVKPSFFPIFNNHPQFMKVGVFFLLIMAFLFIIQQAIYSSWALVMFLASFGEKWMSNPESFFHNNVLQQTDSFMVLGSISLPVLFGLILTWLFVFLLIREGVEGFRKWVGPFVFLPFVIFAIIIGVTLRPVLFPKLSTFLITDFTSLTMIQTWGDAFFLSLISLLLGFMVHAFFHSLIKNGRSLITSYTILIIMVLFSLTTLYFSFVMFSLLPEHASLSISSGPEFIFVTLTSALAIHNHAQLMGGLYFATLAILSLGTISAISVFFTHFLERLFALKRILAAAIVVLVGLALGMVFTSGAGYYFMAFIESFFRTLGFFLVVLLEIALFGWLWRKKKLLQQNLSAYTLFSVRILAAFFIIFFLIFKMYTLIF